MVIDHQPITEIAPGLWCFSLPFAGPGAGTTACYLLKREAGAIIVDTGSRAGGARLVQQVHRLGLAPEDVRAVVATHGHFDHVGGLRAVAAAFPEAQVHLDKRDLRVASSSEEQLATFRRALLPFADADTLDSLTATVLEDFEPVPASHPLPPQLLDGSVRVVSTPGHTAGSTSFELDGGMVVLVGDAVQGLGSRAGAGPSYADAVAYRSSLELIGAIEPSIVAAGHTFTGSSAPGSRSWFVGHEVRELLDVSLDVSGRLDELALNIVEEQPTAPHGDLVRRLGSSAVRVLGLKPPAPLAVPPLFTPTLAAHIDLARAQQAGTEGASDA